MQSKTMHLFAGGGGGLLADLILGKRPIIAVEWDKYACSILRTRAADGWFPDLSVWEGDVRLFNPSEYAGKVDCIHAGFPCQDISVAGKQAGVGEETRSGLYREVLRIADVVRPDELYMENVSAILSNGLGTVLADLSARGYSARWICLRASDVGANHGRDRWWLLARREDVSPHAEHNRDGWGEQQQEGAEETKCGVGNTEHTGQYAAEITGSIEQGNDSDTQRQEQAEQPARPGEQYAELADSTSTRLEGRNMPEPTQEFAGFGEVVRAEQENWGIKSDLGGLDNGLAFEVGGWWEVEPEIGRVAIGVKDRTGKLKALGNGQVPLQAAVAYSILSKLLND